MSNIVVSEEQILNAEECRVIQRTNLRNQGVACADNESMRSLVGKTANVQSWVKLLDQTISGDIYNDTLTTLSISFERTNITSAIFTKLTSMPTGQFRFCTNLETIIFNQLSNGNAMEWAKGCTALKKVFLPRVTVFQTYSFDNSKNIEKIIFPRYSGTALGNINTPKLIYADLGNAQTMGNFSASGSTNFDKLILRNDTNITTLSSTSIFNNTHFATSGGKLFVIFDS